MKSVYLYDDMTLDVDVTYEDYGPVLKCDVYSYQEGRDPAAKLEGYLRFDRTGALQMRELIEQFLAELDGCT